MNLNPNLLQVLTDLGVDRAELEMLKGRMLSSVSSLQARLTSLDVQLAVLSEQRSQVAKELMEANVTVGKLISGE